MGKHVQMIIHTQVIIYVCVVMMQNPNIWRAKSIKKILTGCLQQQGCVMLKKKLNKGKLELTSELWTYFSARSSTFLTSCQLSVFMSTSRQRFQSHASVFRIKTKTTNYTFQSYLQIFGSDSKLPHLDQQKENDWTFRFFNNRYVCLITTGNDRLEKVTPFP